MSAGRRVENISKVGTVVGHLCRFNRPRQRVKSPIKTETTKAFLGGAIQVLVDNNFFIVSLEEHPVCVPLNEGEQIKLSNCETTVATVKKAFPVGTQVGLLERDGSGNTKYYVLNNAVNVKNYEDPSGLKNSPFKDVLKNESTEPVTAGPETTPAAPDA